MIRPPLKIRRVTHFRIVWRGITIKLKYHFQYTKAFRYQDSCDAITVYVIGPNADLCPLTSTGFLAMHIPTKTLRLSGGPVAHVTRLLTAAAANSICSARLLTGDPCPTV